MSKNAKSVSKTSKASNQAVCDFVRAHLHTRLVQAGWDKDNADCVLDHLTDEELLKEVNRKTKMTGPVTDFFGWLRDHKEEILDAVQTVFALLSLLKAAPQAKKPEPVEEEESSEQDDETEDEDEDTGK